MDWPIRYLFAAAPAVVSIGGWLLAHWAFQFLGCHGDIKHMQSCFAGGFDLLPVFGVGLFWLPLLSVLTVPLSVWFLGKTLEAHVQSRRTAHKN